MALTRPDRPVPEVLARVATDSGEVLATARCDPGQLKGSRWNSSLQGLRKLTFVRYFSTPAQHGQWDILVVFTSC